MTGAPPDASDASDSRAPPADDELSPLGRLVAECVRRLEEQGPAAAEALCAEHPELAPELRRRLAALEDTGLLGRGRIGDYILLRTLGRGGMGVVHLARDARDGKLVALKALPGRLLQSESALARFRREAQAIAALRHPGLVPLFEAGESDGVPWFTMEWVDGRTLADVIAALSAMELAAERLDSSHLAAAAGTPDGQRTVARADGRGDGRGRAWVETVCRLVLDVAEALQYAHEHGVIHRDVKPSNILLGRDGRARLFDFGLARVADAARVTMSGDFTGTPAYAAPEQLGDAPHTIDGRADVYALGVTMYELLTLVLPPDGASDNAPVALRRLNPTVGRDVETICLTALERNPARRYASAEAFAADLRAALELRPIAARGPGWPRRVARWTARHRAAALAAGLGLMLLVGAPIGLAVANARIREQADAARTQQLAAEDSRRAADDALHAAEEARGVAEAARRTADEQRALAQAEAERAHRALTFLYHLLASPSPALSGHDVRVRDLLDGAAASAPEALAADPRALADTLTTIGLCYYHLGQYDPAEEQLRAAIALCRGATDGSLDQPLAFALSGLVAVDTETHRYEEAESAAREGLEIQARLDGGRKFGSAKLIEALANATVRRGDRAAAVPLFREVLALRLAQPQPNVPEVAATKLNLATALNPGGDPVEAEGLLHEAIAALRGEAAEGRARSQLASGLNNLALLQFNAGRIDEAVASQREAVQVAVESRGADHPDVAMARVVLAMVLESSGDRAAQIEQLSAALPPLRKLGPAAQVQLGVALNMLGWSLLQDGRAAEAEPVLRESFELRRGFDGVGSPSSGQAAGNLSAALRALKRYDEAMSVLEAVLVDFEQQADPALKDALARDCLALLIELAEEAGQPARAAPWRARLESLAP